MIRHRWLGWIIVFWVDSGRARASALLLPDGALCEDDTIPMRSSRSGLAADDEIPNSVQLRVPKLNPFRVVSTAALVALMVSRLWPHGNWDVLRIFSGCSRSGFLRTHTTFRARPTL